MNAYKVALNDSVAYDSLTAPTFSILLGPGASTDSLLQYGAVMSAATSASQTANFKLNWVAYRQVTRVSLHARIAYGGVAYIGTPLTMSVITLSTTFIPANVSYLWDFGDGTGTVTASTPTDQVHTYGAAGTFKPTVTITDQRNGQIIGKATAVASPIPAP
jgi:PKD domain